MWLSFVWILLSFNAQASMCLWSRWPSNAIKATNWSQIETEKWSRSDRLQGGPVIKRGYLCYFAIKLLYLWPQVSQIICYHENQTNKQTNPSPIQKRNEIITTHVSETERRHWHGLLALYTVWITLVAPLNVCLAGRCELGWQRLTTSRALGCTSFTQGVCTPGWTQESPESSNSNA